MQQNCQITRCAGQHTMDSVLKSAKLRPRGGYSFYVGWYGCAAVLTPFFDILGIELDLFGVLFLIHQYQNDLLGY